MAWTTPYRGLEKVRGRLARHSARRTGASGARLRLRLLPWLIPALALGSGSLAQQVSLDSVERLLQQGRYALAVDALRAMGSEDPRSDYLLGFALLRLYRFEDAEVALRRAVDSEPQRPSWLHALAKSLQEQGRNLAAIEVLDRAIAVETAPEYLFARAMCSLNVGDLEASERALLRLLDLQPDAADALYYLAKILSDRGDWAASLDPLRRALSSQPGHLEARFLLGMAESRAGDPLAAAAAFERVLARVPGHVGALYNLGRVLIAVGQQEEGTSRLEQFRSMSELRDQIDFYRSAVKKNPENHQGRLALADLLLDAGRTEEAISELSAARRLEPREPQTYRLLAQGFRRLGREEDAEQAESLARQLETQGRR